MSDVVLTNYIPSPSEMDIEQVADARRRLEKFIAEWFPEIDTRPNSVFGDMLLTPDAVLLAGIEEGLRRLMSDLNLSNVAQGIVYNQDFVLNYLRNFGVDAEEEVPSSGVIRITFNANKSYVIDPATVFTFTNAEFRINPDEENPVTIAAEGEVGKRVLVRIGNERWAVHLPVVGTSGSLVQDGTKASHTLTHEEIVDVVAAGDFDPGQQPESVPQLAVKAQSAFVSANLTSRAGAVSFVRRHWPQMIGATAVVTGDREMIRDGENILGIATGALDLMVRSQTKLTFGESTVTLTFDAVRGGWVGALSLPATPAFFSFKSGIFQVNNFLSSRSINTVYAKSVNPLIDNLGVSFSKHQLLGILIEDSNPTLFQAAFNSLVTPVVSDGSLFTISGEYVGDTFNTQPTRSISLRFGSAFTLDGLPAIQANVRDKLSGEIATIYFVGNTTVNPTYGTVRKTDPGYLKMFNGLELQIFPASGLFVPSTLLGYAYEFQFKGKTADFVVNYLYEPLVQQVDAVVQNSDNRPVGTSVVVKSFAVCYISEFFVNYRFPFGATVNIEKARSEIFSYINSIAFPNVYEESEIARIMAANGASGILDVTKKAEFYPSLANVYVDKDGNESPVPRFATATLSPPVNDYGFGPRNVTFLLESENIKFNGVVV